MKCFQKVISLTLAFAIYFAALPLSLAQTNRMRLQVPTGWGQDVQGNVPSFRNRQQELENPQMDGGQGLGGMQDLRGMGDSYQTMLGSQYSVHVLGEVQKPGTYLVSASSRVSQAIKNAGGFLPMGSKRFVQLKRRGSRKIVDLVNYELFGSLADNPYLMDNDVIYVPLKKDVIRVVGAVNRPDEYEMKYERSLEQAIKLAGGFSVGVALKQPVRVIRFVDEKKDVIDVQNNETDLNSFVVNAGDVIVVPNVITAKNTFDYNVASLPGEDVFYPAYEDRVFVLGGVTYPGAYPFGPYYTVSQYLSFAGGLNDRGADKYKIISLDGKKRKAKADSMVNPGDTIMVKQHWMTPAAWISFILGFASLGLSATATTLALTK